MTFSASEAAFPRSFATLLDRRYDRPVFLQGLKRLIAAARERIYQEHCGGARGRNVVRHLTALVDDVVRTVFRYALACHPTDTSPCAVLALGGYGRGELNPFSDIDLMFLCHPQPPDRVIRETLYLLWDAGFTLGHSVRTRRDALRMAETDVTAQTAMLEARLVDGDESLFRWFQEEVGGRRFTRRRRRLFVRQKVTECRRRHAAFANTVNLMEPNLKESPGGLRDYHTALWLSMATYGTRSLAELVARGVLSSAEAEAVEAALDFLFTVRNGLHYHYGRKHDVLAVDVQEKLAAELRFAPSAEKRAVEQFLKTYYLHANVIYDFCLATLDAVTHVPRPRWWFRRPQAVGDGFVLRDGRLHYAHLPVAEHLAQQPLLLLQAFAKAQRYRAALAPELSRAIRAHASLLATETMRRLPQARAVFWEILSQPQAAATLRAMHRHGVLGAYIPEFAALTCLVQYDLYHRYTVDEHSLRSIEVLEDLETTREPHLRPFAQLYRQIPDKALLKLALLLHDLGKDVGPAHASHVYRSGELAAAVCARLALSDEQRQLVDKLVVNHLVMNHLAQRRDITDPKVIADFAERVGSVPALDHLYLLTYADTSAVGPDVWTVWKASLLADLYRRTLDYLLRRGAETTLSRAELQQRLRPLVLESLGEGYAPENVERFLATMPVKYLVVTPPETIAKHIRLTQPQLTAPVVLDVEHNTAVGFTTVTFCLRERRGVFAMIAGALSKNRLNILGAQIYTSEEGLAIDTLQVETLSRTPVTDAHVWRQVQADLVAALAAPGTWPEVPTLRRLPSYERKLQAFAQPPQVTIDNACSDSYTVIEVQAQDQLGLLYKLTRLLYESGLDVALAKISTEANRAIDVFYVTDAARKKIVDEATLAHLKETLLAALT